ncbi:MAG: ankyrin repeat domain-containing protein [Rhodospirillales bacterium]
MRDHFIQSLAIALLAFGAALAPINPALAQQPDASAEATRQLFEAIHSNNLAGVKTQIAAGADIKAVNDWGMTAADLAVEKGYFNIAHFILTVRNARQKAIGKTPEGPSGPPPPPSASLAPQPGPPVVPAPVTPVTPVIPLTEAPLDGGQAKTDAPPVKTFKTPVHSWPAGKPNPFDPDTEIAGGSLPIIGKVRAAPAKTNTPVKTTASFPKPPPASPVSGGPLSAAKLSTPFPAAPPAEEPGFLGQVIDTITPDWLSGWAGEETPEQPAAGPRLAEPAPVKTVEAAPTPPPPPPPPPEARKEAKKPVAEKVEEQVAEKVEEKVEEPVKEPAPVKTVQAMPKQVLAPVNQDREPGYLDQLYDFLFSDEPPQTESATEPVEPAPLKAMAQTYPGGVPAPVESKPLAQQPLAETPVAEKPQAEPMKPEPVKDEPLKARAMEPAPPAKPKPLPKPGPPKLIRAAIPPQAQRPGAPDDGLGFFGRILNFFWSDEPEAPQQTAPRTAQAVQPAAASPEGTADESAWRVRSVETAGLPATAAPKPKQPRKPPAGALDGVTLTLGMSVRLGQPRNPPKMPPLIKASRPLGSPIAKPECVEKKRGALIFCIEEVDWPERMKPYFEVNSIMYQGAKTVARYDNGLATFFHAIFPSQSFEAITAYYRLVLGEPTDKWKRSIAPLAEPRRENPTHIWKSVNPVTKQLTTLEIRKFDDARGGFPDTMNGVILLYHEWSSAIFPRLSTIEMMVINSRKNYQ